LTVVRVGDYVGKNCNTVYLKKDVFNQGPVPK